MGRIRIINPSEKTTNYHRNYLYNYHRLVKVLNDRDGDVYSRYNRTANAVQGELLKKCIDDNRRVRFMGAKWSLSEAPYGRDYIVDTSSLNLVLPLNEEDKHPEGALDISNVSFVQSGKKIKSITKHLEARGKSLKTSGASNGQTIGGAIGTGVHGSSLDVGAMQDFVVGLHIITSDQSMVYLERASRPVLNDRFADKIGATIVRDDDLFNAALISVGGFGYIYGVAMEVEDNYLLERHILSLDRTKALEMSKTQRFIDSDLLPHRGERPFHYKLYINPYKGSDNVIVEVMYKRAFEPHESPLDDIKSSYFGDLPKLIGKVVSGIGKSVKLFANALSSTVFPSANEPVKLGTLGEIFYDTTTGGSVFGMAISVDAVHCEKILLIMESLIMDMKVPGLPSIRFVKGTEATIGFTRFDKTAIVEVDGVQWKKTKLFLERLTDSLMNTNVQFGLHWGKNADWTPTLVNRMYGGRKDVWLQQRDKIISPAFKKVFASKFLDDVGMA